MKFIWSIIPMVLLGLLTAHDSFADETKTFFVNPYLVDCVGVGPQKCMQIQENQNSDWVNFYDKIQGFNFVPGTFYKISVKITDLENPPADSSNKKYELIEILEQESTTKHFPYNGICAPGFAPLGEICVLNDRCGPGIYPGKVCVMDGKEQPYLRPTQQGNSGISANNIICAEGMRLIFKSHDGSPACVQPQSVKSLKERGWQTFKPIIACTLEYDPMCGADGKTYGNQCMLDSSHIALKQQGECPIDISEIDLDVTQQKLREMVDDWMKNNQENDRQQRLQIMMSYYAFDESGKQLTTDQDGLQLMNQIRKMVSLDLPREELDQLRQEVREKLQESSGEKNSTEPIIKTGTYSGFCIGYCTQEFTINSDKIIFSKTGRDYLSDSWVDLPEKSDSISISQKNWMELINLVNFEEFKTLPDKIGCPGCADAPVEWIEISYGNETKKIEFEASDEIPEITQLIVRLQEIRNETVNSLIDSFEECASAGNPIMESYPRQCRTSDGRNFVEVINQTSESLATQCEIFNGIWVQDFNECEGISEDQCSIMNGIFHECDSACRHMPDSEMCTLQCVQVCIVR